MARHRLKEIRQKAGLTQEEMAGRIGVSLPHYKNIERGVFDPSYEVMENFAREFPRYKNRIWQVFQKEDKTPESGTKIKVIKDPNFIDEIPVETDWGKK